MTARRLAPFELAPNVQHHFYRGGAAIARFRGIDLADDHAPEDWVGSCTRMFGTRERGLSRLPDGTLLREATVRDPQAYLGRGHVERFGAEPGVLVKLLDAGERLPVHWHPTRSFARRHLACRYGKTEAWVVLEAEPGARVHLGWRRPVVEGELDGWLRTQDAEAMLGAMHAVAVGAGDTVLVPAATPHAIGAGVFLVELQEPTDFSVLLEWRGFDIDGASAGHLGLGFDVALRSVGREPLSEAALEELTCGPRPAAGGAVEVLFPPAADAFFRCERVVGGALLEAGFSILVVVDGAGAVRTDAGAIGVERGATILVPYAAGDARLEGGVTALRCRPPLEAPEPLD